MEPFISKIGSHTTQTQAVPFVQSNRHDSHRRFGFIFSNAGER